MAEERQKIVKTLSKIIYVVSKILKILTRIAIGFMVFAMIVLPVAMRTTKFIDNKIVIANENNKIQSITVASGDFVVMDDSNKNYDVIKKIYSTYSKTETIIYMEVFMILVIASLVIASLIMDHVYQLFKNIYEGEAFSLDNTKHLKMISNYMIASLLLSVVASLLSSILFDVSFNLNLYNIFEILIVYTIAYVFEYGFELQKSSKKTMFSK